MKKEIQTSDYGIYIDHSHYVLVSIKNDSDNVKLVNTKVAKHVRFQGEGSDKVSELFHVVDRKKKKQDKENNDFIKICKSIIEQLENPKRILVFGPSDAKFELQKEIKLTKALKNVQDEIKTTDKMSKGEITRFVNTHFSSFTSN